MALPNPMGTASTSLLMQMLEKGIMGQTCRSDSEPANGFIAGST
jgi:hypothetical protein